jgi:hypothetical protein
MVNNSGKTVSTRHPTYNPLLHQTYCGDVITVPDNKKNKVVPVFIVEEEAHMTIAQAI